MSGRSELAWIHIPIAVTSWTHASIELFHEQTTFAQITAAVGLVLIILFISTLYVQCCMQRRVKSVVPGAPSPSNANLDATIPLSRTSSRDSYTSEFSPLGASRKNTLTGGSPHHSFHDLVELTKPALQHIGASLPVSTLQRAVSKLNDRLQYRFVTSKTHVGGGLSSIFVAEEDAPAMNKNLSQLGSLDAFAEDYLYQSDDEESEADAQTLMQTEQAFRRSEGFSSLPETILKLIVRKSELKTLSSGEILFRAGERKVPAASTYVLVSGELALTVPRTFFKPSASQSSSRDLGSSLVTGIINEIDEEGELEDETLKVMPGKTITGISDFIATIVGEPIEYIATATATKSSLVAEIRFEHLEQIFDAHEGVREDLLQRYLALLQRVTFTSVYRLTGRYASSFGVLAGPSRSSASFVNESRPPSPLDTAAELEWTTVAGSEFGISPSDLITYAKERRKRTTLRRLRSGSFLKGPEDVSSFLVDTQAKGSDLSSLDAGGEFPSFITLNPGDSLSNDEVAIYMVLSGGLEVRTLGYRGDKKGTLQVRVGRGQCVGHLKVLTRTFAEWYRPRMTEDEAAGEEDYPWNGIFEASGGSGVTRLLKISEPDYFELVERFPEIVMRLAKQTVTRLAPLVRLIDVATNFFQTQPGDAVIKQGELVDGLMVVLHGRVRYYHEGSKAGREFGRGAVLGESSFLTHQPSMHSVVAMRRTSLACVPKMIVRCVAARYPNSLAHIGRTITKKMMQEENVIEVSGETTKKRRAVAVLSVSPNVPFDSFIHALSASLNAQGIKAAVLGSSGVSRRGGANNLNESINANSVYGREYFSGDGMDMQSSGNINSTDATTPLDEIEILSRIQDAEESNDVVLLRLDAWSTREDAAKWSRLCVAQADAVLLVANASDKVVTCPLEKRLRGVTSSARRELVMLHVMSDSEAPTFLPKNTKEWIQDLGGVVASHQVKFHPYDVRLDTLHWRSDMRRLGRWITGNAVGLVLGGGGARGAAHLSVLRALEACQVPVDFIGGTSIGAFVGGLYCMKGGDMNEVTRIFGKFAEEMSSTWNTIRDLTFPLVAYLKGYQFNRSIVRVFGDSNIEDFWINFYCVSTDLTDSREIAHRNGFAWKYIRASMTLTGYLPPICDVQIEDGSPIVHYLVDGGYIDNMPVDEMRRIVGRSGIVIAVDVQSAWKLRGEDYGDDLNGWWYLWKWLSPFHPTPAIPTASEIQSHLAFISCVQRFGRSMKEIPVDLYVAPPLGSTLTLEFNRSNVIQAETLGPVMEKVKQWLRDPKIKRRKFLYQSIAGVNGPAASPQPATIASLTPPLRTGSFLDK